MKAIKAGTLIDGNGGVSHDPVILVDEGRIKEVGTPADTTYSRRRGDHRRGKLHPDAGHDGSAHPLVHVQQPDVQQLPCRAVGDHPGAATDVRALSCAVVHGDGVHDLARPRPEQQPRPPHRRDVRGPRLRRCRHLPRASLAGGGIHLHHRLPSGAHPAAGGAASRIPERRRAVGIAQARPHQSSRGLRPHQDLRIGGRRYGQGRARRAQHDAGGARRDRRRGARFSQTLRGALLHSGRAPHGARGRLRHDRAHGLSRCGLRREDRRIRHPRHAHPLAPDRPRDRHPQGDRYAAVRARQDEDDPTLVFRHVPGHVQGRYRDRHGHRHGV